MNARSGLQSAGLALAWFACVAAPTIASCSGSVAPVVDGAAANGDSGREDGSTSDARTDPSSDADAALSAGGDDGVPSRDPCTSTFGRALSVGHGRLDGFLVAIVPPNGKGCNADSGHVHLQVKMNAEVYDVAVTIVSDQGGPDPNVYLLEKDVALPGEPWSEGWHTKTTSLDYVASLGAHSTDFTAMPKATLAQRLATELASANHVSVYATGYGPDGAHKVHRNTAGMDGMIVVRPTEKVGRAFLFHFATQSF